MQHSNNIETDRDLVATILSIIPGLGHLYKRHIALGIGILTCGNLFMILITGLLSLATFGLALLVVPAAYTIAVAISAHELPDWHDGRPLIDADSSHLD